MTPLVEPEKAVAENESREPSALEVSKKTKGSPEYACAITVPAVVPPIEKVPEPGARV